MGDTFVDRIPRQDEATARRKVDALLEKLLAMKILSILPEFPAAVETFILNQLKGLIDRGHDVDVFAERESENISSRPPIDDDRLSGRARYAIPRPRHGFVRVAHGIGLLLANGVRAPRALLRTLNASSYGVDALSLRLLYAAIPLLRRRRYDVIHCHFGPSGMLGVSLRAAGVVSGRLVTTFYGYDVSSFVKYHGAGVYTHLFERGDLFLALSEKMREELVELGCDAEKLWVHHLGVALDQFPYQAREVHAGGVVRLVTAARLVEKKGLEYAIRAVARLVASGRRLRFDVIGDGPLREPLARLIADLAVGDVVSLLGWRDRQELTRLFGEAHVMLVPSVTAANGDQEGTPTVILEAMASGMPVVATRHSGIPEQVVDNVTGYLVPERDVDALVETLAVLVDRPGTWAAMGMSGRRRVAEQFDIEILNDRLVQLYRQLLV